MFWHIPGHRGLHGVVIGFFQGEYHLFTTQNAPAPNRGPFDRVVHHSVSTDRVRWRQLPFAMGVGPAGAFDGGTIYDLQVIEHAGAYYMFYTGLDLPSGPGQHQAIGVATSTDLLHWQRHPANPVVTGDRRYYEPFVPDESTYQEKDRRRQWFRDPWVYRDPATGRFGMAVGARAAGVNPDVNGCLSWAESDDLIHWTPRPPLYCPHRYHTMECPVIFDLSGRTYLLWLTHPEWGAPLTFTDPWQRAGDFYAFSTNGVNGPYQTAPDEVLIGGASLVAGGSRRMRAMVARTVVGLSGAPYLSYHLSTTPEAGDEITNPGHRPFSEAGTVMPRLRPLSAAVDGRLLVGGDDLLDADLRAKAAVDGTPAGGTTIAGWKREDGVWTGKQYAAPSVQWLNTAMTDGVFSAQVRFDRGLRAGLVFRANADAGTGVQVMLDRNLGCIEYGLFNAPAPLDRRRWMPREGWTDLRIVALGPSIEIYVNGALMLHEIRFRETEGRLGLRVDQAQARFRSIELQPLKPGTPLLTASAS